MPSIKDKKMNTCLFGGALHCAGLAAVVVATQASADIVPFWSPQNRTVVEGYDNNAILDPTFSIWNRGNGGFSDTSSYSGNGVEATAYTSATLVGARLSMENASNWWFAEAHAQQYFTVANSKHMLMEWDFGGFNDHPISTLSIWNLDEDEYEFHVDANSAPGSEVVTLTPGVSYILWASVYGAADNTEAFARASNTVPAPGGLAIVGLAGFVAAKRRRLR